MNLPSARNAALFATLLALLVFLPLTACAPAKPATPNSEENGPEDRLQTRATTLLAALRDGDANTIAQFIHPTQGVRLSPYAYVDIAEDQVFTPTQFLQAWQDDSARIWGSEDATGESLALTCSDYLRRFIYDADYLKAEQTAVDHTLGQGNTINNARAIYPQAKILEYHFSGFDPKYEGLDWKSLRLVFEKSDGDWYLIGIIHDQWTS